MELLTRSQLTPHLWCQQPMLLFNCRPSRVLMLTTLCARWMFPSCPYEDELLPQSLGFSVWLYDVPLLPRSSCSVSFRRCRWYPGGHISAVFYKLSLYPRSLLKHRVCQLFVWLWFVFVSLLLLPHPLSLFLFVCCCLGLICRALPFSNSFR